MEVIEVINITVTKYLKLLKHQGKLVRRVMNGYLIILKNEIRNLKDVVTPNRTFEVSSLCSE